MKNKNFAWLLIYIYIKRNNLQFLSIYALHLSVHSFEMKKEIKFACFIVSFRPYLPFNLLQNGGNHLIAKAVAEPLTHFSIDLA